MNGLTARDIKLVVDGGYNTVESVAYTCVGNPGINTTATERSQAPETIRNNQRHIGTESRKVVEGRHVKYPLKFHQHLADRS